MTVLQNAIQWRTQMMGNRICFILVSAVLIAACKPATPVAEPQLASQQPQSVAVGITPSGNTPDVDKPDPREEKTMFRDSYNQCAESSTGVTGEILDCIAEEFEYQDARLNTLYRNLQDKLPQAQKTDLQDKQREWLYEKEQECRWDASTEGQGQLIDAKSCALNRTVVRADKLERMLSQEAANTSITAKANLDNSGRLKLTLGDLYISIIARNCDPFIETLFFCDTGVEIGIVGPSGKGKQVLRLPALYVNTEATAYRGPADGAYWKDGYSIIVADLNDDKSEDLAIQTGKLGSYGGPSYDIYLYDPSAKIFVVNRHFSELTIGHSNMFAVSNGRILASSKSGCCFHTYETYVVEKNRPKLVEIVTEDATGEDQQAVRLIKRLIDGKLQTVQK